MLRDSSIDELARRLARRDTQVRVPVQRRILERHAVITAVDHSAGHCGLQMAGSLVELSSIPYVQAYNPSHLPRVGHTVVVHCSGPNVRIIGQHVSPFDFIIP